MLFLAAVASIFFLPMPWPVFLLVGALVLEGMCFYQSYAREMGQANGWKRLMTNSVKLTNIIGGYGYQPTLSNMENCVASAIAGEIV